MSLIKKDTPSYKVSEALESILTAKKQATRENRHSLMELRLSKEDAVNMFTCPEVAEKCCLYELPIIICDNSTTKGWARLYDIPTHSIISEFPLLKDQAKAGTFYDVLFARIQENIEALQKQLGQKQLLQLSPEESPREKELGNEVQCLKNMVSAQKEALNHWRKKSDEDSCEIARLKTELLKRGLRIW